MRENSLRTFSSATGDPSETIAILPSLGICLRRILQPIHPARRAWIASGFLFSMALSEKKVLGMRRRFRMIQFGEY